MKLRNISGLVLLYCSMLIASPQTFEANINPKELNSISDGMKYSLAPVLGRFQLLTGVEDCPSKDFKTMQTDVGLDFLVKYVANVMILAGLYEDSNRPEYFRRLVQLIKDKKCATTVCKAAASEYEAAIKVMAGKEWQDTIKRAVANTEKDLIASGISKSKVREFVFKLASKYPRCLASVSSPMMEQLNVELSKSRGCYLYLQIEKKMPLDLENFKWESVPIDKKSPTRNEHVDAWGEQYGIEVEGGRFQMLSSGPDRQFKTADDLDIEKTVQNNACPN